MVIAGYPIPGFILIFSGVFTDFTIVCTGTGYLDTKSALASRSGLFFLSATHTSNVARTVLIHFVYHHTNSFSKRPFALFFSLSLPSLTWVVVFKSPKQWAGTLRPCIYWVVSSAVLDGDFLVKKHSLAVRCTHLLPSSRYDFNDLFSCTCCSPLFFAFT
jgi:hypothetical protein